MRGYRDVEMKVEDIKSNASSKKMLKSAKDLIVFKQAYAFSLAVHKASLDFLEIEQFSLANQLRRASKSICANIVEGFSRQSESKVEFKRFLTIAIGSANETGLWINYASDLEYIDQATFTQWTEENNIIIGMLVNLRNKL